MFQQLAKLGSSVEKAIDRRIYGVAVAQVINNVDALGEARVQVLLPWLPGFAPWARLAVLSAGLGRGTYFVPQVGDEVLVAFNHGDVREPYVIGSLWNTTDRPPALLPTDPITKRVIRTPLGHQIEFDEALQTVTITTSTFQTIKLDPTQIELSTTGGAATVTLNVLGSVSIQSALSIELKAPTITLEGGTLELKGAGAVNLNGGAACNIQAALVKIN
jgi:phage baseplate assembly protein gpV